MTDALAAEPQPVLAIFAVGLDREHRIDAVRLAQLEIILAMVGRHMDQAGAAVGGDELAGQEGAGLGEEAAEMVHRVAGDGAGEVGAFDRLRSDARQSNATMLEPLLGEARGRSSSTGRASRPCLKVGDADLR